MTQPRTPTPEQWQALAAANLARSQDFSSRGRGRRFDDVPPGDFVFAMAGEVGELLNAVKHAHGRAYRVGDNSRLDVFDEGADVLVYADLVAQRFGLSSLGVVLASSPPWRFDPLLSSDAVRLECLDVVGATANLIAVIQDGDRALAAAELRLIVVGVLRIIRSFGGDGWGCIVRKFNSTSARTSSPVRITTPGESFDADVAVLNVADEQPGGGDASP